MPELAPSIFRISHKAQVSPEEHIVIADRNRHLRNDGLRAANKADGAIATTVKKTSSKIPIFLWVEPQVIFSFSPNISIFWSKVGSDANKNAKRTMAGRGKLLSYRYPRAVFAFPLPSVFFKIRPAYDGRSLIAFITSSTMRLEDSVREMAFICRSISSRKDWIPSLRSRSSNSLSLQAV